MLGFGYFRSCKIKQNDNEKITNPEQDPDDIQNINATFSFSLGKVKEIFSFPDSYF